MRLCDVPGFGAGAAGSQVGEGEQFVLGFVMLQDCKKLSDSLHDLKQLYHFSDKSDNLQECCV